MTSANEGIDYNPFQYEIAAERDAGLCITCLSCRGEVMPAAATILRVAELQALIREHEGLQHR